MNTAFATSALLVIEALVLDFDRANEARSDAEKLGDTPAVANAREFLAAAPRKVPGGAARLHQAMMAARPDDPQFANG